MIRGYQELEDIIKDVQAYIEKEILVHNQRDTLDEFFEIIGYSRKIDLEESKPIK